MCWIKKQHNMIQM